MYWHGRVRFVNEHRGAWELMQLAETRRLVCSQCFEELYGGSDYDWSVPKRGEKPEIGAPELGQMVMRRNDLFRVFAGKNKRFPVDIHRLLNDVGVWQHNEDMPQPKGICRL
jgi:hypothetical protein